MTTSLYDLSVANFLQGLAGVEGYLGKALSWCQETGADPETIVESRIHPDMLPFRFQIVQVVRHSAGALDVVKSGAVTFDRDRTPHDYAALQQMVAAARQGLAQVTRQEVDARAGHDVVMQTPDNRRLFTAENFILSFSLPNFYFHATTAYDILRAAGVPVGKRDFTGPLRLKETPGDQA